MSSRFQAAAPLPIRRAWLLAAALLALACVGAGPEPPAPNQAPEAPGLGNVPDAARPHLHPSTALLPPFPNENPALLDPATWGKGGRDQDRICTLELRTYARGVPVSLGSVRERRPGQPLSARYLCAERTWRGPRYAGPFYVWNGDGSLVERSFRTTDGTRYREDLYQYRGNGLVWAYRRRERNEDLTGPAFMLDEYYGPDGRLAGFAFDRTGEKGADSTGVRWVRGAVMDDAAFRKWAAEFPAR